MTIAATVLTRWCNMGSLGRPRPGSMTLRIERWDVRRDGPLNEGALRQKLGALGYEVAPAPSPIGAAAIARADTSERIEGVVRGLVKVTIDGESGILTAGDVVFVPRGAVRHVEVVGVVPASILAAVYRAHTV